MLLRQEPQKVEELPFFEGRQRLVAFAFLLVAPFGIDDAVAGEEQRRTGGAKEVILGGQDIDGQRGVKRRLHLARQEAPPDQLITAGPWPSSRYLRDHVGRARKAEVGRIASWASWALATLDL